MSTVDQSLFSSRQLRRSKLERLVIPRFRRTSDGRLVRTNGLKHLLRVIESHSKTGGAVCLNISTIGREMGCDEKTVSRHVADAQQVGLLIVNRANGRASKYSIEWSTIGQVLLDNPETAWVIDPHSKRPETPVNLTSTPPNLGATPVNLSNGDASHTPSSRARALKPCINHVIKPSCGDDDFESKNPKSPSGFAGWPKPIYISDLKSISSTNGLWLHAISQDWGLPDDPGYRVRFFTLAKHVATKSGVTNPGGYFTKRLMEAISSGVWQGSQADEMAARKAIDTADGQREVSQC